MKLTVRYLVHKCKSLIAIKMALQTIFKAEETVSCNKNVDDVIKSLENRLLDEKLSVEELVRNIFQLNLNSSKYTQLDNHVVKRIGKFRKNYKLLTLYLFTL